MEGRLLCPTKTKSHTALWTHVEFTQNAKGLVRPGIVGLGLGSMIQVRAISHIVHSNTVVGGRVVGMQTVG